MTKHTNNRHITVLVTALLFIFPVSTRATLFYWSVFREGTWGLYSLHGHIILQAGQSETTSGSFISRYFIPYQGEPQLFTRDELFRDATRIHLKHDSDPQSPQTPPDPLKLLKPEQCQQRFRSILDWSQSETLLLDIQNSKYKPIKVAVAINGVDFYHYQDRRGTDHYEPFSSYNFLHYMVGLAQLASHHKPRETQDRRHEFIKIFAQQIFAAGIKGNDPAFGTWCKMNIDLVQVSNTALPGFTFSLTLAPLTTVMLPIPTSEFDAELLLTLPDGHNLHGLHHQQVTEETLPNPGNSYETVDLLPPAPEPAHEANYIGEEIHPPYGDMGTLTEDQLFYIATHTDDQSEMIKANSELARRERDFSGYSDTRLREIYQDISEPDNRKRAAWRELERRKRFQLSSLPNHKQNPFDRGPDRRDPNGGGAASQLTSSNSLAGFSIYLPQSSDSGASKGFVNHHQGQKRQYTHQMTGSPFMVLLGMTRKLPQEPP